MEWLSSHSENYGLLVSAESVQGDRVPIRFARRGETVESKQPLLVLFNHDTHMATLDPPPTQQTARKRVPKPKISNGLNSNNLDDKENEQGMDTTYETTTPLSSKYLYRRMYLHKYVNCMKNGIRTKFRNYIYINMSILHNYVGS